MTTTTQIGSGRPLFILPNGRFDQITRAPLIRVARHAEWERMGLMAPLSRVQSDVKILTPTPELDRLIAGLGY